MLGRDAKLDVAVVRIGAAGTSSRSKWRDRDQMRVGDNVFAVGSQFAALRDRALARFARLDASRSEPDNGLGIVAAAARVHRAELRLSDAGSGLRAQLVFTGSGDEQDIRNRS